MAAENVGNAYVGVIPKVEGNPEGVGDEIGSRLSKGAKTPWGAGVVAMGNMMANALTSVASNVGSEVAKTFWNYADYEQLVGGVDKLFGDASGQVQKFAQEAYKTSGLSANEYMQQATMFSASLLNDLGGDTAKAAEMADVAMRAMSDNVNTFGSDAESVQNAIQGMARGEYSMLDNLRLGYSGSKEGMAELIKDANEYAKSQGLAGDLTMDSFADQIQAIELIQEKQGIAGTTAKEAASTVSGSLTMLQSSWDNLLTAIGDGGRTMDLSTTFNALLESLGAVAMNVGPALFRIGQAIATQLPPIIAEALANLPNFIQQQITDAFGFGATLEALPFIQQLSTLGTQISAIFANLQAIITTALAALLPVIQPVVEMIGTLFMNGLNIIMGALVQVTGFVNSSIMPTVEAVLGIIQPVVSQVASLVTGLALDVQNTLGGAFSGILGLAEEVWPGISDTITTVLGEVAPIVSDVIGGVLGTVQGAFDGIKEAAQTAWPAVSSVIKTALNIARSVVTTAVSAITGAFNAVRSIPSTVRNAFNSVKTAITNPINTAKNAVNSAINRIKSIINGAHLELPKFKLPHFNIKGGSLPWGIGGKGTPPSISVDWYAKGGIVDGAQLIGAGERGAELVWPAYDPYMDKYANAIASHMPGEGRTVNVYLDYHAGEDANQMVRDIARGLNRKLAMEG